LAALFTAAPWTIASGTTLGAASALATAGLVILVLARNSARLLPVGTLLVAASFALTGHAASAPPRWLTGPALGLHVLCAAFWLGAFVPLLWSLGGERAQLILVMHRFSVRAMVAVGALILTGATLAWIQLGGSLSAATSTAYGWRLLLKLALVALLLGLALVNRLVLTPALPSGAGRGVAGLRRTLIADIALALAVLAVTATFPLSPPPRAAAAVEEGVTVVASSRGGQATITLLPGRVGANRVEATVVDRDGLPIVARSGEIAWSMPEGGFEPLHLAAALPLPGVATGAPVTMPKPGRWRLRLDLLVDDYTKLTFEGAIDLR
jgi:copper transport protein